MRQKPLATWRREAFRRMERQRRGTLSFLGDLPEREVVRPRTQGEWSIKDVLAHFVAWEAEGLRRLQLVARGQGDRIHYFDDMREADRFNALAVRRARAITFPALLGQAARVRLRLIEALRRLPLRALQEPSHRVPVVRWLPEFAWTHERTHLREMKAWWKEQQLEGAKRR